MYVATKKWCEQGLITKKCIAMHTNQFFWALYSTALLMIVENWNYYCEAEA